MNEEERQTTHKAAIALALLAAVVLAFSAFGIGIDEGYVDTAAVEEGTETNGAEDQPAIRLPR